MSPFLLYADGNGNVFEDKEFYAVGRSGWDAMPVPEEDWLEFPDGASLYVLPDRVPIGVNVKTGELGISRKGFAVAAFIPPAHTGLHLAAYEKSKPDAVTLPLFCYTAVGWQDEKFYVAALRIEQDIRQECSGYDDRLIEDNVEKTLEQFPTNRLLNHLGKNCALTYHCPAARNLFLNRWECPVPVSKACNANCLGCISFQPQEEQIVSTQDRLVFTPTCEEIVEFTLPHLQNAPYPIISFGQGCEGEPLLQWKLIKSAIEEIRKQTDKGSININTNGSNPDAVRELCKAGLNSIRVSANSVREEIYTAYYRPNNYCFDDIVQSIKTLDEFGGWSSLNYFVFPGMTDAVEEYEALRSLIKKTNLKMIQWRNFNIDPDWYLKKIGIKETGEFMGVNQMMHLIKEEFPDLQFGYFNPSIERIKGSWEKDFAH